MCCLELLCGNLDTLVCAYSATTILINNHCLYIVISLLLNIFLIRSTPTYPTFFYPTLKVNQEYNFFFTIVFRKFPTLLLHTQPYNATYNKTVFLTLVCLVYIRTKRFSENSFPTFPYPISNKTMKGWV